MHTRHAINKKKNKKDIRLHWTPPLRNITLLYFTNKNNTQSNNKTQQTIYYTMKITVQ